MKTCYQYLQMVLLTVFTMTLSTNLWASEYKKCTTARPDHQSRPQHTTAKPQSKPECDGNHGQTIKQPDIYENGKRVVIRGPSGSIKFVIVYDKQGNVFLLKDVNNGTTLGQFPSYDAALNAGSVLSGNSSSSGSSSGENSSGGSLSAGADTASSAGNAAGGGSQSDSGIQADQVRTPGKLSFKGQMLSNTNIVKVFHAEFSHHNDAHLSALGNNHTATVPNDLGQVGKSCNGKHFSSTTPRDAIAQRVTRPTDERVPSEHVAAGINHKSPAFDEDAVSSKYPTAQAAKPNDNRRPAAEARNPSTATKMPSARAF